MEMEYYTNPNKVYVCVKAVFYPDGGLKPTSFVGEDGQEYQIAKVTDIRRAASLKAGGTGVRYTCKVNNKEVYIFLEEDRWFMEKR